MEKGLKKFYRFNFLFTSFVLDYGIYINSNSTNNINSGALVNIETSGQSGQGICTYNNSTTNIAGNVKILMQQGYGVVAPSNSGNNVNILSSAQIYFNVANLAISNGSNDGNGNNILNITAGAKLAFEKDGSTKWYQLGEDYKDENTSTSTTSYITADNLGLGFADQH